MLAWCGHCKALKPIYSELAKKFAAEKPEIKIAKLDASENKETAGKFEVEGFPTLKFMIKQIPIDFDGERTVESFTKYLEEKTQQKKELISTAEVLESAIANKENATAVFYGDENSIEAEEFYLVQHPYNDVKFSHINDKDLAEKFGFSDSNKVGVFVDGDKKFYNGNMTFLDIGEFIEKNMFPAVNRFSESTADFILDEETYAATLIAVLKDENEAEATIKTLKEVQTEFVDNYAYSYLVKTDTVAPNILEFFNIKDEVKENQVLLLTYQAPKYKKFRMETEYNKANILEFLNGVKDKKINPIYKSQPVPANQTGAVLDVVSLNFKEEVLDSKQDVLIEFYSPSCGFCKKLEPVYSKLAEQLKEHNENIKVVKIDATENDVEDYDIDHYPSVFFVPATTKQQMVVKNEELSILQIVEFLKKNTTFKWVPLPLEETEKAAAEEEAKQKKQEEAAKKEEEKKPEAAKEGEKVEL